MMAKNYRAETSSPINQVRLYWVETAQDLC